MSAPLYSLVLFGRNDDYNPDFLYRVQTTLNFNAQLLARIGKLEAVEFIVVDWGSAVALRDVLALNQAASFATLFLEVPLDYARRLSNGSRGIPVTRASNIGIRRARGKFIGMQGADLIMPEASWLSFLGALEKSQGSILDLSRACVLIPRRQVPWSFVARQPGLDAWEQRLLTCDKAAAEHAESSPATAGGMGIMVLHRDIWHAAKGLEESFHGYGYSDIDMGFRVGTQYPWIDTASYGVVCYKMQHDPAGRRGRLLKGKDIRINCPWITPSIHARQDEWGIPSLGIEPKKALPKSSQSDASSMSRWHGRFSDGLPSDAALFAQADVRMHASAALGGSHDFDKTDWELLTVLSWFGLRKFPMSYLEIGMEHDRCVRAISTACPSVDLFVVEDIRENSEGCPPRSAETAMSLLWQWGHKGYFRPLIGEPVAAFEKLAQSFIGPFELELLTMNLRSEDCLHLLPRLLSVVVPGGLLALRSARAEVLAAALEMCTPLLADGAAIYVGDSGCTGFIFVQGKHGAPQESVAWRGVRKKLPPTSLLTVLQLRAAVLVRQLSLAATRLSRLSRWPAYFRMLIARGASLK